MDNNSVSTEQENEPIEFWEPFTYLAFFIFFNLVLLPNAPKQIRMNDYDIEIILYGAAGVVAGLIVYRFIRNTPSWFKFALVGGMYAIILLRLILHWKLFTVPGN